MENMCTTTKHNTVGVIIRLLLQYGVVALQLLLEYGCFYNFAGTCFDSAEGLLAYIMESQNSSNAASQSPPNITVAAASTTTEIERSGQTAKGSVGATAGEMTNIEEIAVPASQEAELRPESDQTGSQVSTTERQELKESQTQHGIAGASGTATG